ncbi:YrrS family protein [Sporosarcina highlanderae]|uniref:DUF1510 family protein n=1 Tax=Sporosarcina highlanderae TaxID=3035916 RepID=A0ABT8JPM0_9BACL|nr:DUF1510 family protein [Sporosarcina highlanderae]MDN4607089.1 DUF1510 family protein [Sporosarcina highlanderae]
MNGNNSNFSRMHRKKRKNRGNQLLNSMIGLVVILILIVGFNIFTNSKDDEGKENIANTETQENIENSNEDGTNDDGESGLPADDEEESNDSESNDDGTDSGKSDNGESDGKDESEDTVTIVPNDEEIVVETIIDASWKPIGTVQTGEHVSIYKEDSVDWEEKKDAIAYATKLPKESLIYWMIKNGGGPQKSIGIVSTRDKSEKFRVYIEWVDGQGWQPVKMDILNTLDFEY